MAGVAVFAAGGMACGAVGGGGGAVIDWDLSSGHSRADVDWPSGDSDGRTIDDVKSVRIRLPGGLVVEERKDIEQVLLDRQEDVVEDVVVYFPNETAERAVERARAMAGRYELDDKGSFEKLLQEVAALRGKNSDEGSGPSAGAGYPDDHKVGPDEPALEVRVLAAPDPERRWYVQLRLDWVGGELYDWDLSKTHTVTDVGGGFPADGSTEAYVPNITHLRIALAGSKEFRVEGRAGEVRMLRTGDVITRLHASFGEPSPEAAHRRAVELADQWGAPTSSLDGWLSSTTAAAGSAKEAVPPVLVPGEPPDVGGPLVAVGLRYEPRFNGPDEQPWVVDFVLSWDG